MSGQACPLPEHNSAAKASPATAAPVVEQPPQQQQQPPQHVRMIGNLNDISKIPCLRESLLWGGAASLTAGGIARYKFGGNQVTRVLISAYLGFALVAIPKWHTCRVSWNEKREQVKAFVRYSEEKARLKDRLEAKEGHRQQQQQQPPQGGK